MNLHDTLPPRPEREYFNAESILKGVQALYPEWEAHELLAYGFNPHINHIRVFFTRKDQEKIIYCRHFSQIDYIAAQELFRILR